MGAIILDWLQELYQEGGNQKDHGIEQLKRYARSHQNFVQIILQTNRSFA